MTRFHRKRKRTRDNGEAPPPAPLADDAADDTAVEPDAAPRHRPRVGSPAEVAAAVGAATTADTTDGDTGTSHRAPRHGSGQEDRETERGLRGLVGSGTSQVGVEAALRARDAARPTAEDLATAEAKLTIVRRYWTPH